MRITVKAKPGSRKDLVYRDDNAGQPPTLVVHVRARAVDGAANAAVVKAVAEALAVRPRAVTIARGATARTKLVEVDASSDHLTAALAALPNGRPS